MPESSTENLYIPSSISRQFYRKDQLTTDQKLVSGASLISEIGNGNLGRVYKARSDCKRIIAVKIVPFCTRKRAKSLNESEIEDLKCKALAEAVNHLKLDHCNIIRLVKVYSRIYSVIMHMEYFNGYDLLTLLRRKDWYIDKNDAEEIVSQLSSVLSYIHDKGIAHGDLHLGNVMVDESNRIKLIDFGCATSGSLAGPSKLKDIISVKNIKEVLIHRARYPNESFKYYWDL